MPGILSPVLGNRALPFSFPHSALNPITHVEVVSEELYIASVAVATKSAQASVSPASSQASRLRLHSLQARSYSALPTQDYGFEPGTTLVGGGVGVGVPGGGEWGAGGDFDEEPSAGGDGVGDVTVGIPEEPSTGVSPFYSRYRAPISPAVQPAFGDYVEPAAAYPSQPAAGVGDLIAAITTPTIAAPVVTREVVGVVGAAVFSLLNTGRAPLAVTVDVYGRVGSVEIFVAKVKKTLPAHSKPVRVRAAFALEGDAAKDFYDALMAEYGETSKATLICDAVVRWAFFTHKVSDARPVDVVSESAL